MAGLIKPLGCKGNGMYTVQCEFVACNGKIYNCGDRIAESSIGHTQLYQSGIIDGQCVEKNGAIDFDRGMLFPNNGRQKYEAVLQEESERPAPEPEELEEFLEYAKETEYMDIGYSQGIF